jgi:hypothetical protein
MADNVRDDDPRPESPLVTYEADENEGRKAFLIGLGWQDCPHPPGSGGNIRRLAWMRGFYAEKYWERHKYRSGWDE